jgi:hypothetical protein
MESWLPHRFIGKVENYCVCLEISITEVRNPVYTLSAALGAWSIALGAIILQFVGFGSVTSARCSAWTGFLHIANFLEKLVFLDI